MRIFSAGAAVSAHGRCTEPAASVEKPDHLYAAIEVGGGVCLIGGVELVLPGVGLAPAAEHAV